MELSGMFQLSRIFLVACELDIFSRLSPRPKGIEELSKELGINSRSLEIFLNGLCATGVLKKEGDVYANSPEAEEYLVKGKESYRGNIFMHASFYWDQWSDLKKTLVSGKNQTGFQQFWLKEDRERINAFIRGMDNIARDLAPLMLEHFNLEGKKSMLDLGGGPGTYSIAFLRKYPELMSTIFDLPMPLKIARENIERNALDKRVSLKPGDFLKDDIGQGYDFVWMSHILHSNSDEECRHLIKKVFKALGKKGIVGIHDFFLNRDKVSPRFAAIFAVHMLAVTEKGRTYTHEEVSGWLEKVGFGDIEVIEASENTKVIRAVKI